ncbi:MAG TPA: DUF938 domain-containing protein [Kofleriaceae bacterium]
MKRFAPSTGRNAEPIREVLARVLPATGTVLEIASGTGQHAVAFARAFPDLTWVPSDPEAASRDSIDSWRAEAQLPNLAAPIDLDVRGEWPALHVDAILCVNMIHISPWDATQALFAQAGERLAPGAVLVTYGPYRFHGVYGAESNAGFNETLKARDTAWGVRDVDDLSALAKANRLALVETVPMPANNHTLVFRRQS